MNLPAGAAPYVAAYLVLAALLIGSFINVAADRLPRRESLWRPRSRCRACGRQLNVVDLIPVFGYVIRGGRCASCAAPIGVTAPLVEGVAGSLMALAIIWQGLWPGALSGFILLVGWGLLVTIFALRRGAREPKEQAGPNS
ncbi:MAG: prepilin peptidase [Candidatus Dormibacterales bacterium]